MLLGTSYAYACTPRDSPHLIATTTFGLFNRAFQKTYLHFVIQELHKYLSGGMMANGIDCVAQLENLDICITIRAYVCEYAMLCKHNNVKVCQLMADCVNINDEDDDVDDDGSLQKERQGMERQGKERQGKEKHIK
uniref:Uncharacterized protein n=1 Tax=Glossina palpalis gambiensis TaxID=67801 RepID=A0A1B0BB81_9MUSC